jgi:hypothetical protein
MLSEYPAGPPDPDFGSSIMTGEPPPSIDALPKREDVLGTQVDSLGTNRAITIAYAGKKPANYRFYFALAGPNSDKGKCKPVRSEGRQSTKAAQEQPKCVLASQRIAGH